MMTNAALKLVPDHAVIYNYPNGNSMPQYLKMGWHKFKTLYTRIFSSVAYSAEREGVIDSDYFHWWVSPQLTEQYRFVRRSGKYYLAKKMGRGRYLVFGQINKEDTYKIKEATPILLTYLSRKRSIYNDKNKTAGVILSRCPMDAVSIPSWKTDVL